MRYERKSQGKAAKMKDKSYKMFTIAPQREKNGNILRKIGEKFKKA